MPTPTHARGSFAHPAGAGARTGIGRAHAKAILLGEHAAVYGAPALAIPLHGLDVQVQVRAAAHVSLDSSLYSGPAASAPERLRPVVTAAHAALDRVGIATGVHVQIASSIPHERGLGSSAAVAAAVARSVAHLAETELDGEALYEIVQEAERAAHGNPSGLDARAVTAATPIRFRQGIAEPITMSGPLVFLLADSGESGSTAAAVAQVSQRRAADSRAVNAVIAQISELTEAAVGDLTHADVRALGARMTAAHELLCHLGVSNASLDALVTAARAAGAAGAKLTGGGQGGCIIVLATSTAHAEELATALRTAGARRTWITAVPA